jgi:hypothetical protein
VNGRPRGALLAALAIAAIVVAAPLGAAVAPPTSPAAADLALGRKLVAYGTCNDCHTPGWSESDGKLPVSRWMTGSPVGYRGPWGTIYAANVRLEFRSIDEGQWLAMVATRGGRAPMVWHDLRALDQQSLRAIYRFIRALGPAGSPAPSDVPPDREPSGSYYNVLPVRGK